MYAELTETRGFFHGTDTGTFDPYAYIDLDDEPTGEPAVDVDVAFLREGSVIALLCGLYDLWNEGEDLNHPWGHRVRDLARDGRLWRFPDVEQVILEAFERDVTWEDPWLDTALEPIFERYVLGRFADIASRRREQP
ncbi:hypothetical protein [Deinococcus pimensis]|uniref:hypothetical protein n=1 Tax=Deinococcus pimensis TaxID=309888 RepID=UPI00048853DF|nr:hypothetical protein [Deinococcus pimensis]